MKQQILPPGLFILILSGGLLFAQQGSPSKARIWEEEITLPSYLIGEHDKNPRFFFGNAYQGAQGRIYPYSSMQVLTNDRVEKSYKAVYLENEYLKISIVPEFGGKIFTALDKTNDYKFVYSQTVVKPVLIGMLGAWISGGVEWNAFHHHRNTSFLPVDYQIEENPDGSVTAWVGEIERRHRMKWRVGVTLHPGKSYIEATMVALNRSPLIHSMLYFANISVHTGDGYQVFFPPATEWVTQHAKREFASWPVAHETYNRVDFDALGSEYGTDGVDISKWENNIKQISYFAYNYEDDWVVGYDHGKEAGTCVLGDHHTAPGKKFWTTSAGPQGLVWDAILTDNDGPASELMIGGYSDNQPDYSWILPGETKAVTHYFFPVRNMFGGVKNASKEAALNLEIGEGNNAEIAIYATSRKNNVLVRLTDGEHIFLEETVTIGPDKVYNRKIRLPESVDSDHVVVSLMSEEGEEIISYCPEKTSPGAFPGYSYEGDLEKGSRTPMPEAVKTLLPPSEIESVEMLYLNGIRLEQFHNATLDPMPYFKEALRRDPEDFRVNTAVGINLLKKSLFDESKEHLQRAAKRATWNYTRPRDTEPFYYLGVLNKLTGNYKEAIDALNVSAWDYGYHSSAHHLLAEISCIEEAYGEALHHLDLSLSGNANNSKALGLRSAVMRRMGNASGAYELAKSSSSNDVLDFWSRNEIYLSLKELGKIKEAGTTLEELKVLMRDDVNSHLELAVDYGNCGMWDEAIDMTRRLIGIKREGHSTYPILYYYTAYCYEKKGDPENAGKYYDLAVQMPPDYCFPFRTEMIFVLRAAMEHNPGDAMAPYYLGNLLFDSQPEEAIRLWEKSKDLNSNFATVYRNLGRGYDKTHNNLEQSIGYYEKAVALDPDDSRVIFELDDVYKRSQEPPEIRLAFLQKHHDRVVKSGYLLPLEREIELYVITGQYDRALEFLRSFHLRRAEGGERVGYHAFVDANLLRGIKHMNERKFDKALADFHAAGEFPLNMEAAPQFANNRTTEVLCYKGTLYESMGKKKKAREAYELALKERISGRLGEHMYFRGYALKKLKREGEADDIFGRMIESGKRNLESVDATTGISFFAKFGDRLTDDERKAEAHYQIGLGLLGFEKLDEAEAEFEAAAQLDVNHIWSRAKISEIKLLK